MKRKTAFPRLNWQPIATAPNGEILLYYPAAVTGAYAQHKQPEYFRIGRKDDTPRKPTHWHPLNAPQASGGER